MKHFTKCLKFLLLALCVVGGGGSAWADETEVLSWSRSSTTDTSTSGFTFSATAAGKSGYYQDASSGVGYVMVYHKTAKLFSSTPSSITFTANVGGGSGNKDLSSCVYVCFVDESGNDISGTEVEVTGYITTNTGDTYNVSLDANKGKDAYGVKIYHDKESGYNVRYFSFSLSYEPASAPASPLASIALSGTYQTTFTEGDTFNHDGMIVTATYADASTKNVTASATFSDDYDMSEPGNYTVTVSYTENEVTKTATYNITVNAIPTHTVTWSVNGATTTDEYEEGASITLPSTPANQEGKVFQGWVTAAIDGTTNTKPDFVTPTTMGNADITYYAVFADAATGESNVSMTINTGTENFPKSYGTANTFTEYNLNGSKFKIQQAYINGTKLQWRAEGNSSGTGIMYNTDALNKIQTIVLTYDSSDSNKNFTVKVGNSENPTSGTSISPSISGYVYTFDCSAQDYKYFVMANGSGAGYLSSIVITYKGETTVYSDYCTTVAPPSSVATPTFTVAGGTYTEAQSVEIECETDGVTIYYTTNGDNPTTSSTEYTGDIEVSANTTIKAIAVKNEEQSNVANATYYIKVAAPTFSVEAGTYDNNQSVEISTATAGATIYYTTNGSEPTTSSSVYSSAITVNANMTLKAIAVKDGMMNSDVSTAEYVFKVATPTFSVEPNKYSTTQTVELSTTTEGATIYYRTDGYAPTKDWFCVNLGGNSSPISCHHISFWP